MFEDFPLVSIGVPIFNGGDFIIHTLNSINQQTYRNIEIVIVDDGSSDDSYQQCLEWTKICRYSVHLIKNPSNLGLTKTCNLILEKIKGKYIQIFGQDDLMLASKIETDIKIFENQNENVAALYSDVNLINEKGEPFGDGYFDRIGFKGQKDDNLFIELIKSNFIPAPSVIMRTELLKKSGGYDESLQFEDWDMWLRLAKEYKFLFHNSVHVRYRIHKSSMMANKNSAQTIIRNKANIRMFQKHLGHSKEHDDQLYKRLRDLVIYSYFLNDTDSLKLMSDYLNKKTDIKIWLYHKMAFLGMKHPATYLK